MLEYITAVAVCLIVTWMWSKSRPSGMPPGPMVFPIVNNILSISTDDRLVSYIENLHKKYGPIVSFSVVGHGLWDIWVQGYDLVKEVFHDPRFTNRSIFGPMAELKLDQGLVWAASHVSKARRKTMLQIMRVVGVGKTAFVTGCEENTESLLSHLHYFVGKPLYLQVKFSYSPA